MLVSTPEEAKAFVKRWMDDRKVFLKDSSDDTFFFAYDGACGNGVNFSAQQPKDVVRAVGITAKMLFPPQHLKILSDLDPTKRNEFFGNFRRRLLLVSPSFQLGPNLEAPEWIFFLKEISYDELTEGRLIEAVEQINRAVIWAATTLFEQFGVGELRKE